ncbi:hypothetical protein MXD61_02785 [Frankia sp. AgPm24]|uniref:hypothetical protein n=1 Tax=Frankia sp. AgPm24 TaxID=631128 RepID=UPI00201003DD|nr:hypothetical protein [Frankia sp. AgPm24]MCK9920841.1 hypothetical protein [Frankia sp. AgPm24]
MTVCGLVRLDGVNVRRAALTAMLASSARGLPAARGVHLDGVFGAVTAAEPDADPTPPLAVDDAGLLLIADRAPRSPALRVLRRSGPRDTGGQRTALRGTANPPVTVAWETSRSRLVLARPAGARSQMIIWTDGRVYAFGTELEQVRAAVRPRDGLRRPRWLGQGEVLTIAVPVLRRPVPPTARGQASGPARPVRDSVPCR